MQYSKNQRGWVLGNIHTNLKKNTGGIQISEEEKHENKRIRTVLLSKYQSIKQSQMSLLSHRCRAILTQTRPIQVHALVGQTCSSQIQYKYRDSNAVQLELILILLIMKPGAPTSLLQLKEVDPDLHSFLSRFFIRSFPLCQHLAASVKCCFGTYTPTRAFSFASVSQLHLANALLALIPYQVPQRGVRNPNTSFLCSPPSSLTYSQVLRRQPLEQNLPLKDQ